MAGTGISVRSLSPASLASVTGHRRAAAVVLALLSLAGAYVAFASEEAAKPYRVVDGRVDRQTYNGYRRYNAACNHCHGPDGSGSSFGPSLVATPLLIDSFRAIVLRGRASGTSVMRGFAADPNIAPYVDDLYAYLRARADGALGRGRPALDEEH